ncbi:LCP family protein [Propionibacteriaceae bacterium G1746]|uniref:LCP family protein n=1 Tax=Aestuariimicrobium sp. G57 TaxID=3418485 RepID=UPI003C1E4445
MSQSLKAAASQAVADARRRRPRPEVAAQPAADRAEQVAFRRGVGMLLATLLLPGSAQLQAGNKTVGRVALRTWGVVIGLVVLALVVGLISRGALVTVLASGVFYKLMQPVLVALAIGWALLLLDAWRLSQPLRMPQRSRLGFGVASLGLAVCVAWAGIGLGSAAHAQGELLGKVLGGGGISKPHAGRYNVLMLGADSGADRVGLRPDSIMVASVAADTGRAVMFSLPRNLEGARFPEGSPLRDLYPDGYECPDHSCMLNAVYTLGQQHKDLYPGVEDPGLQAMREVVTELLGLPINYTVMVDLQGFTAVIDAVGGITMDVGRRVPIGGGTSPITGWIEPGKGKKLDGYHALWFARSRTGASDYERMLRQKCVVNAMLQQLDPVTVLTKFNDIAAAGGNVAFTDVPSKDVNKLATLALKTRALPMKSISFTPPLLYPGNPKLEVIRDTVKTTIAQSRALDDGAGQPTTAPATTAAPKTAATATPSRAASRAASKAPVATPTSQPTNDATPAPQNEDLGAVCSV